MRPVYWNTFRNSCVGFHLDLRAEGLNHDLDLSLDASYRDWVRLGCFVEMDWNLEPLVRGSDLRGCWVGLDPWTACGLWVWPANPSVRECGLKSCCQYSDRLKCRAEMYVLRSKLFNNNSYPEEEQITVHFSREHKGEISESWFFVWIVFCISGHYDDHKLHLLAFGCSSYRKCENVYYFIRRFMWIGHGLDLFSARERHQKCAAAASRERWTRAAWL